MRWAEGELHGQDGRERVQSVTKGAARRQVLLWFDSLWSVHLSQMSSFIIAELYRTTHIYEIYSKGLDKGVSETESAGYGVSIWWHFVVDRVTKCSSKATWLPVMKTSNWVTIYRSTMIISSAFLSVAKIFLCTPCSQNISYSNPGSISVFQASHLFSVNAYSLTACFQPYVTPLALGFKRANKNHYFPYRT